MDKTEWERSWDSSGARWGMGDIKGQAHSGKRGRKEERQVCLGLCLEPLGNRQGPHARAEREKQVQMEEIERRRRSYCGGLVWATRFKVREA